MAEPLAAGQTISYREANFEILLVTKVGDVNFVTMKNDDGVITVREDRIYGSRTDQ